MKTLETYLLVNENSIVGNFETITDACDFIRNVVIRQCVTHIPTIVETPGSLRNFDVAADVVDSLNHSIPHYTIRKMINIKGYEASNCSCD